MLNEFVIVHADGTEFCGFNPEFTRDPCVAKKYKRKREAEEEISKCWQLRNCHVERIDNAE